MRAVEVIAAKRNGEELSREQLDWFIAGFASGDIPDYQASAFLMAVFLQGMTPIETAYLTQAMVDSGRTLDLSVVGPFVGDKHSTGGVGDKTTLVVGPLVAAAGIPIGKMSGRGLGFSGGTLDKLDSIKGFRTELSPEEFVESVRRVGLVIASQTADLAPADGRLYALRDVTATVESVPLIASSIMSKKIAAGANAVVLDVKVGRGAFMKTLVDARALAVAMRDIGSLVHLDVRAVVSGMDQPLGNAVGNALEVAEAVESLRGKAPPDLMEVSLTLGAHLLLMGKRVVTVEEGKRVLRGVLASGAALSKFRDFVTAQGGEATFIDDPERLPQAPIKRDIVAPESAYVASIDAEEIGHAAVDIGAGRAKKGDPIDFSVGFVLAKKIGDRIEKGEPLVTVHAGTEAGFGAAESRLLSAFTFSQHAPSVPPLILEEII